MPSSSWILLTHADDEYGLANAVLIKDIKWQGTEFYLNDVTRRERSSCVDNDEGSAEKEKKTMNHVSTEIRTKLFVKRSSPEELIVMKLTVNHNSSEDRLTGERSSTKRR